MSAWHVVLTMLGGLLELTGFALIYREIRRVRRVELGQRSRLVEWVRSVWDEVRRTVENPVPAVTGVAELSGRAGATASGSAIITTEQEDPLVVLRRELDALTKRIAAAEQRAAHDRERLDHRVDELSKSLQAQVAEQEEQRKEDLRQGTRVELAGVVLFVIGIGFNVAANLVT